MEPTVRRLRRGEAEPGLLVEWLGEPHVAFNFPEDPTRIVHAGHPGRIDIDEEPHVVVIWHGLADTDECQMTGHNPGAHDDAYALGIIDQATYDARATRSDRGEEPIK